MDCSLSWGVLDVYNCPFCFVAMNEFKDQLDATEKDKVTKLVGELRELAVKGQAADASVTPEAIKEKIGETQQASLGLFQKVCFSFILSFGVLDTNVIAFGSRYTKSGMPRTTLRSLRTRATKRARRRRRRRIKFLFSAASFITLRHFALNPPLQLHVVSRIIALLSPHHRHPLTRKVPSRSLYALVSFAFS